MTQLPLYKASQQIMSIWGEGKEASIYSPSLGHNINIQAIHGWDKSTMKYWEEYQTEDWEVQHDFILVSVKIVDVNEQTSIEKLVLPVHTIVSIEYA